MGVPIEYEYWSRGDKYWCTAECVGIDFEGNFIIKCMPYSGYDVVEQKKIDPDRNDREIRFPEGIPAAMRETFDEYNDDLRIEDRSDDELLEEVENMNLSDLKDLVDRKNWDIKKSQNKGPLLEDIKNQIKSDGKWAWAEDDERDYTEHWHDNLARMLYGLEVKALSKELRCSKRVLDTILRVRRKHPEDYPGFFTEDGDTKWSSLQEDSGSNSNSSSEDEGEKDKNSEEVERSVEEAEEATQEKIEEKEVQIIMLMDVQFVAKLDQSKWVGLDPSGRQATGVKDQKSKVVDEAETKISGTTGIGDGIYYCIPEDIDTLDMDIEEIREEIEY